MEFTPSATASQYAGCTRGAVDPALPAGATVLTLGDDDFATVSLAGDNDVLLYGQKYGTLRIGSNGYVTFLGGDTAYQPTAENHFDLPRVSALFADLDPGVGGTVGWVQQSDRFLVQWFDVPLRDGTGTVNVRLAMHFDGDIEISYFDLPLTNALSGISEGEGVPPTFVESDLGAYPPCSLFKDSFDVLVDPSPGTRRGH